MRLALTREDEEFRDEMRLFFTTQVPGTGEWYVARATNTDRCGWRPQLKGHGECRGCWGRSTRPGTRTPTSQTVDRPGERRPGGTPGQID